MEGLASPAALPVGEVVQLIRQELRQSPLLRRLAVVGELDRLTVSGAGHWYFSLRDAEGRLDCVAFAGVVRGFHGRPQPGEELVVQGEVEVYAPRGQLQFKVSRVLRGSLGEREAERRALIERLRAAGVLDRPKRALPWPPRHVGIVTGAGSAALADLLRMREVRWPGLRTTVVTSLVQGEGALVEVPMALEALARMAAPGWTDADGSPPVDVIIVARGGGSQDDLWTFNEAAVVDAVTTLPVPVVSAIGHESDLLVTDLVADARAATPTAAIELVIPHLAAEEAALDDLRARLGAGASRTLTTRREHLETLARRLRLAPTVGLERGRARLTTLREQVERHGGLRLEHERRRLDRLRDALEPATARRLASERSRLERVGAVLHATDPRRVLERGFSLVSDGGGQPITTAAAALDAGQVDLAFHDGRVHATVEPDPTGA